MRKPKNLNNTTPPNPSPTPSEFAFTVTRTAVAQICQSVGYRGIQLSAIEALTNVAALYLQSIAQSAATFANSSNRTDTNVFDLINAFQDLAAIDGGFTGNSYLHNDTCLLKSAAVLDLSKFVSYSIEIPFAKPVPRANPSAIAIANHDSYTPNLHSHIPRWLPAFPDESTYKEKVSSRRKELWEDTDAVSPSEAVMKKIGESSELAKRRGRVRFRIGRVGKFWNGSCRDDEVAGKKSELKQKR